jgi:hypothetical protein
MKQYANTFSEVQLEPDEDVKARAVSAYTYFFLQNKIAAYAKAVLEFRFDPTLNLQVAVIEHECAKSRLEVLQELLSELTPPIPTEEDPPESPASHQ